MLRAPPPPGRPVRSVVKWPYLTTEQVDLQDQTLKCSEHTTEQVDPAGSDVKMLRTYHRNRSTYNISS